MTMALVSTVTVGAGGAASIEFTSIPQTGTDLLVQMSLRTARSALADDILVVVNSDTTSGRYTMRQLLGSGAGVASSNNSTYGGMYVGEVAGSTSTANTFGSISLYIPNYAGSTQKNASADAVHETNGSEAYQHLQALLYNQTSAVTSILIKSMNNQNLAQYSTASLYTITKGSGGATVS